MAGGADSVKSIIYALSANLSIAVAKFAAFIITGSGSMLAESIHSVVDSSNQGLLLYGLKRSKKPVAAGAPLGHGRTIYFWSFIVALMLFSAGGLFALYEGWHKFQHPEALKSPWIAVGVLTFAIVAEGISFFACVKEVKKVLYGRSYWQWFKESRQSELLVIFGEDLAAMIGLVFALCAVVVAMITGNPMYDALGSMAIGILLIIVAIFIGIEVKSLLIGEGVEPHIEKAMKTFLVERSEINDVYHMIATHLGNDVMVAIKAKMSETNNVNQLLQDINTVEKAFKEEFTNVRWCFFEPDLTN